MMLVVHKYGGTSVANLEKIRNVAQRVLTYKQKGDDVLVVVSAMSGETDRLLKLAGGVSQFPDEREVDVLLATGEQVTSALLAMMLKEMGYDAVSLQGSQVRIITDSAYGQARIAEIEKEKALEELRQGKVVVVPGFQGVDEGGNITTLGRGGSDTTAVALAAALKADLCEIYTDVDGVYTTDPNITDKARSLDEVSYDEMLEMASLGAKVLHIRSVELAKKFKVPLMVKSSFTDGKGTLVCEEVSTVEQVVISGVTYNKNEGKVTLVEVPDKPGIATKVFAPLSEAKIVVDMIVQNVSHKGLTDITFTVGKADVKKARKIMEQVAAEVGAKMVAIDEGIAKVSIVGSGMRTHAGVAAKMFSLLSDEGINIQMISTSEIKVSCVVDEKYGELAVRTLHTGFGLDAKDVEEEG
jgi:aspartate kinase